MVRVAGNVATDEAIGSIDAIEHLHAEVIVVSSATRSVGPAAIAAESAGGLVPERPQSDLSGDQRPAGSSDLDKGIRANVSLTAKTLSRYSHVIPHRGHPDRRRLLLDSGRVTKV